MSLSFSAISFTKIRTSDVITDILLIALLTTFIFSLTFHPFFFGDELIAYELAAMNESIFGIFHDLNANKPRLVFNGIGALLAEIEASRLTHAVLVATCMTWINVLIFTVARYQFNASRLLAWMLVLGVLSSRYGVMLYFDYLSGLIETLSSALFLSTMLLAWLAYRNEFNAGFAAGALVSAIITGLVHERYMVGALAIGGVITLAECFGASARRRRSVVAWAMALGVIPFVIYWLAVKAVGSLPITTVGGDQRVALGTDTLWTALTYLYNVLLGGNYGHEWYWGAYNHSQPRGRALALLTAFVTVSMTVAIFIRKGFAKHSGWVTLGLGAVIIAFIAIASLAGTVRQEARFMFPVGILVLLTWFLILENTWRHAAIASILVTNMMYLMLGSHDSMVYVYGSRGANSLASSLLTVKNPGTNGIVAGNTDNLFVIGGGAGWNPAATRRGETFSRINLASSVHIDPYAQGDVIDGSAYDFGLAFDGFAPHRTATYRWVTVDEAIQMAGAVELKDAPVKFSLASRHNWANWQWDTAPEFVDGALKLTAGRQGWFGVSAEDLHGNWLVVRARATDKLQAPLRLQVNWLGKEARFLTTTSRVVNPHDTWSSYTLMLRAPPDAETGYVFATLHGEVNGVVEVEAIEIK